MNRVTYCIWVIGPHEPIYCHIDYYQCYYNGYCNENGPWQFFDWVKYGHLDFHLMFGLKSFSFFGPKGKQRPEWRNLLHKRLNAKFVEDGFSHL